MPKEVKLILEDDAWDVLKAMAVSERRSVQTQAKVMMEDWLENPYKPKTRAAKKPLRNFAGEVFDAEAGKFISERLFWQVGDEVKED